MVVKLGTGVLTDPRKQPDLVQMEQLVAQIAAQHRAGREVVLVSSGAVGAGMGALGYESPQTRHTGQWAAVILPDRRFRCGAPKGARAQ